MEEAYPALVALKQKMSDFAPLLPLVTINRTLADKALTGTVLKMQEKIDVFEQLREAMRIAQPDSRSGLNDESELEMTSIKERVTLFRHSEKIKQLASTTIAYTKMVKQIDKYWDKLFADPIQVTTKTGIVTIQPQRTNNVLEQFFRYLKRKCRRRNGNHSLSKTLKTMIAETPLVKNLENPQYMKIILNGKANLAERFAKIDIDQVREALAETKKETQRYPKRMAKVFKIPHLPKRLTNMTSKKMAHC